MQIRLLLDKDNLEISKFWKYLVNKINYLFHEKWGREHFEPKGREIATVWKILSQISVWNHKDH